MALIRAGVHRGADAEMSVREHEGQEAYATRDDLSHHLTTMKVFCLWYVV